MSRAWAWATATKLRLGLLIVVGVLLAIQLVPYGHDHSNPPVTQAVAFDGPRTEQLFDDACADCHSNLTNWPFESNIAPTSWLIQHDVDEGRGILNASEWDRPQADAGEVAEVVQEGEMPPLQYKVLHPGARLSDSEKTDLIAGLTRTYQDDPPGP